MNLKQDLLVWIHVGLLTVGCGAQRGSVPESPETACEGRIWLASNPHVPLAQVMGTELLDARTCCAAPQRESVWSAVGAYGELLGSAHLSGTEFYDVTECFENTLTPTFDGAAAFVQGNWDAPLSARWEPDEADRQSFFEFARTLDRLLIQPHADPDFHLPSLETRTLFFEIAPDDQEPSPSPPTHFAAFGGYAFAVAVLPPSGSWYLSLLDTNCGSLTDARYAREVPARVLGVFDVNGDGVPEIIGHWDASDSWGDVVFRCDVGSSDRPWTLAVQSPGGSTA